MFPPGFEHADENAKEGFEAVKEYNPLYNRG